MNFKSYERWLNHQVNSALNERQRRQSIFLSQFLLLSLLVLACLTVTNLFEAYVHREPDYYSFLVQDGLWSGVLLGLFFLNRRGFVNASAYGFMLMFMIAIPYALNGVWMPYSLLVYAVPIQAASFILQPRASIPVALLSILSYIIGRLVTPSMISGMGVLFLGILGFLAVASWLISERLEDALDGARQSEKKYVSLLEKSPFCVYLVEGDQTGRWVYLSPRFQDLAGYEPSEWVGAAGHWARQLHPDDRQRVLGEIAQTLRLGLPFHSEYRMLHRSGKVVWVSDDARLTRLNGQNDQVQGVLIDISARKWAEQVQDAIYRISEAAFSADDLGDLYQKIHQVLGELMHAENFFIALHEPDTDRLVFPYFVDQYDAPPEPALARHGLTEYVLRTGQAVFATQEKCAELVAQGEISDVGTPSVDWLGVPLIVNGHTIGVMVVQSYTAGIRFSNEELDILKFVSTQVGMVIERKRTEAALHEINQLTSEVISGVNTGIIVYDQKARHLIWNQYMENITGLPAGEVLGHSAMDLFPLFRRANFMSLLEQAMTGETVAIPDTKFEIPTTGKSGWFGGVCGPHRNAQGEIIGSIAVLNEITERKMAEDALRAVVNEKEVLVREIHHRVKNNLQVMSSLISLQAEAVQDVTTRGHFHEMQARVRSMALIHEELYQSEDLSQVNFSEYINKLASGLMQTTMMNPKVNLTVDVEDVLLGVDVAIPCGLIVNELVTNSFKYAFPGGRAGEVVISLHVQSDGMYYLGVRDNGIGLPENLSIEHSDTLGLQLITILTRQLRGSMRIERASGTRFEIAFKRA